MSKFLKYPALLLCALLALDIAPCDASGSPQLVAVVGGGEVQTTHADHVLMVAIVPLAKEVGVPVRARGKSVELNVDGSWLAVTQGDLLAREERAPMMTLTAYPLSQRGTLYVSAADAISLLDVNASVQGKRLVVDRRAKAAESEGFSVRELPTPTPLPTATAAPAPVAFERERAAPAGKRLLGTAQVQMNSSMLDRSYNAMFDGGTDKVHASLYATGEPGSRLGIGGTVRVGEGDKHAAVGGVSDPLYGNVFSFGGGNGFELENAAGTTLSWLQSPLNNRHVAAIGRRTTTYNAEAAYVSQMNSAPQVLVGLQQMSVRAHGVWEREAWVGLHGIAGGVHYRSDGRLYTDARMGFAGAGLPLQPGDAPTQLTAGYDFFKGFGLRGGYGSGRGQQSTFLAQLYGQVGATNVSLSKFGNQSSLSVNVNTSRMNGALNYYRAPSFAGFNSQLAMALPRGFLSVDAYAGSLNTRDIFADYHLKRESPSMSIGLEDLSSAGQSRIGPTIGYMAPVTRSLSLGLELHPLLHGNGMRFSLQQALFQKIPGPADRFLTIAAASRSSSPLYLMIDGSRDRVLTGNPMRLPIPSGSHYVSLQSADGTLGSPEEKVVDGTPAAITVPLWPIRHVSGTLRFAHEGLPAGSALPPASGITVIVQPEGIVAQTDENGAFDFPAQALDPDSSIVLDETTLPPGFAEPAAMQIPANGNVSIVLKSSKNIQKVIF